jgi:glyoxylase-like metal-dependent hydrolase (beta-lactamase superfamily II)
MAQQTFRFKLGNFECLSVLDTIDSLDMSFMFPQVPPQVITDLRKKYNLAVETKFHISALFIKTPKHRIMIDTGLPSGVRADSGMLVENLRTAGIRPEDIDTVILSHGHLDHIGGNIDSKGKPTFPNARYVMNKKEFEFWTSKPELKELPEKIRNELLDAVNKNLLPLKDSMSVVESGIDIIPGIQYLDSPGHSPGHCCLLISSGADQMVYAADVIHNSLQLIRPDWKAAFDLYPDQAVESRTKMLNRVISMNAKMFACHFAFPCVGKIVKKGDIYAWEPLA